jgi:hypothetical protein
MFSGTTPSEQYLARLCKRSFLSLWSFPNVFNDDGITGSYKLGKEVCDLLVVFGSDVIIFSDKSCSFKDTGRLAVDWNRWYKKSIIKSADQIYGAERWIKKFPGRLFLDPECKIKFPIDIPEGDKIRVHRVAVAVGAKEPCRAFYKGGSGSLRIVTDQDPVMHSDAEIYKAFTVGYFDEKKGYVHVFDDVTLDIVMRELDTISDFCAYLRKKEELIARCVVRAGGEEELLTRYLTSMDNDEEHGFAIPEGNLISVNVEEGHWDNYKNSYRHETRKNENYVSYIWDNLIEYFNNTVRSGKITEPISLNDYERGVRRMASVSRVERRMIGRKLKDVFENTPPNATRFSAILTGRDLDLAFPIVLLPPIEGVPYEEYQLVRRELLAAYASIIKLKNPQVREAVGIAMEPRQIGRGGSEDIGFFDFTTWTDDQARQAAEDQKRLRIVAAATLTREYEYPDDAGKNRASNSAEARRRRRQMERAKKRLNSSH